MSSYVNLYRCSAIKLSTKTFLSSSSVLRRLTISTTFPTATNVSRNSETLAQCHLYCLTSIQSAKFSTTYYQNQATVTNQKGQSEKKDTKDEELELFSRYEKAAVAEDTHFHSRHKQAEEKTKALISVKSAENTQGISEYITQFYGL